MKRLGMTIPLHGVPLAEQGDWLRELVDLGYSDLWTMETSGLDAFTPLATAAVTAPELRLGTAIASVFTRGPALLAMTAAAMAEAAPGRFVVGIGASSDVVVQGWNDMPFEAPYSRMRDTLRFLREVLSGQRVEGRYESFEITGFALERPPGTPPPIYVAALRERMLRLAGAEADGVVLGLLTASDVPRVVSIVQEEAAGAETDVVLRLGVCPTSDIEMARARCRRQLAAYLNVPTYAAFHAWLGRGEELQPLWDSWKRGDRRSALAAVPDALVDALYVHGPPEACREQIAGFVEAGVTTPVLSLMPFGGDLREAIRALSPAAH